MFKFFRKYNKIILVVGGVFLMIAFLVGQTLQQLFTPGPENPVIGTIDGEEVTARERQVAAAEIDALSKLSPIFQRAAQGLTDAPEPADEPLKWLLMVHDAERMGLSVSEQVVSDVFAMMGVTSDAELRRLADQAGAPDWLLRQAMRHWLLLERYQELVLGDVHIDPTESLALAGQGMLAAPSDLRGPRLSEPLVRHALSGNFATTAATTVLIGVEPMLDDAGQPSEQQLEELYQQYRDVPRGQGEPYGFGYRIPERVRLNWLELPRQQLLEQVSVEPIEVYEYYQDNQDEFTTESEAAPDEAVSEGEVAEFAEVRDGIRDELRQEKARELGEQIIHTAQAMLQDDVRGLPTQDGYRQLPEDFQPTSLEEVASEVEAQFGVRPIVHQRTDDWTPVQELTQLQGIGEAQLMQGQPTPFALYVASARELRPGQDNPLRALGLQVGVPSRPLEDVESNRYLFRLTAAEPARAPESLDEVREQVVQDWKRREAFHVLEQERDRWLAEAREQGLETVGALPGAEVVTIPPTPRQQINPQTRQLMTPWLPQIGQSEKLIDALFEQAAEATQFGQMPVEQAPLAERVGATALPEQLALAVFEIEEYNPMTREQYEQVITGGMLPGTVRLLMPDARGLETISFSGVADRVNWEPAQELTEQAEGEAAEPAETDEEAT
ncbi:MAG: hypothetical protein ACLFVN_01250 [Phycisphaeraceae bacterium]